jgi:hypothetical protein
MSLLITMLSFFFRDKTNMMSFLCPTPHSAQQSIPNAIIGALPHSGKSYSTRECHFATWESHSLARILSTVRE